MLKISRIAPTLAQTLLALDPYRAVLRADPCAYCGAVGGTLDHIRPVSHGGPNHWSNLTGACASCNHEKCSRPLLWFLFGRRTGWMPPRRTFAGLPRHLRPMQAVDVRPLYWSLADPLRVALGLQPDEHDGERAVDIPDATDLKEDGPVDAKLPALHRLV